MNLSSLLSKIDSLENSPRQSIFESIGGGDSYFRTWEREIHPVLCEVAMSPEQIQQLFKGVETGAGRSALGKAGDAVKGAANKISDAWFNKFGGMLQSSGPVQAFDQKYEEIKSKIAAKNPELAAKLAKYGEFAKNNPNLHKFLLGIAGSAAAALGVAVAGGIGAGALAVGTGTGIAVGIVNIADRLLQGQKASTAIGRGATAGAVAGITAGALAKLGSWAAGLREKSVPIGDTGLEQISYEATRKLSAPGMEMNEMVRGFNVTVDKDTASAIRSAVNGIQNGDSSAFSQLQDLGRLIRSAEYKAQMKDIAGAAKDIALSNDSLLQWIKGLTQAASSIGGAAAGQAAAGAGEKAPTPVAENQLNELFGITGNKVDASKLQKAWEKAGSPTDSEEIAKILQTAGVDSSVISKAFTDMSLPEPASIASKAPAEEPAAAPAGDQAQPATTTAKPAAAPSATGAEPPATPAATQQSKVGVGQINKIIPGLRIRDLTSVQKTVDATLAKRGKTTPAPQPTAEGKYVGFYSKFLGKEI